MEMRKGQDIYCEAIRLLPPEVREKASFLFVGKAADKEMMDAVRSLTADYPQNVFYCKRLSRDEIKNLMEQCTCLVCASRDDPMPTFVTEGLIFGKPSIVSEHTGTAGLITEDGTYVDNCGFTVAVFDASGLAYYGGCCSSLEGVNYVSNDVTYDQLVLPQSIRLSWEA